ncbi:Copine-8 [Modicella reniformis]|uniref:Copine-8 n=1 Tax=Modicella reniformis TaxID=1440133 RepID=A0A9P6IMC2_9FUNG|nr:Copine-8 [Modicella reniformis]
MAYNPNMVGHMPPSPSSKVELKVRCKKLPDRDTFSKSDPQVFLFLFNNHTGTWSSKPHATTERIKNSLSPDFIKGLELDYHFETIQRLKFVVFDIDDKHSNSWSDQDYLAEAETDLGSIIGSRGRQLAIDLRHPKFVGQDRGKLIIRAEEMSSSKRVVNFKIRALDLTKKGLFKSRPSAYIVIQRGNDSGTFSPVYRSKHIDSEDDPIWKEFPIKETVLCNGDLNRPLKIEVMNKKDIGAHTLIGSTAIFTVAELSRRSFPHRMPIPPMTGTSALIIQSFSVEEPPSFMDFIAGGGNIGLCVAIDFTQSNGIPSDPTSLHHKSPTGENEYTRAIRSVGNILQCYDTDKKFPVYGFGGRINGQVSHAFPLNGNPSNPEVQGVDGILAAYWHAHSFVELYGPTNFANIIGESTSIARHSEPYSYTVLLILTDGAISDMDATVRAIKDASNHALSIVIVGIGNASFTNMDVLDGDDDGGIHQRKKSRDIVQFVAARDYPTHMEYGLSEALLNEIPEQFLQYMKLHNIKPKPPARVDTAFSVAGPVMHVAPPVPVVPIAPMAMPLSGPITGSPYNPPVAGSYPPAAGAYPPPVGLYFPPSLSGPQPVPSAGHQVAPATPHYAHPAAPPPPTGSSGLPTASSHYPGAQPQHYAGASAPWPVTSYPGYHQPYGTSPPVQQVPYSGGYPSYPAQYPPQYAPQHSQYAPQSSSVQGVAYGTHHYPESSSHQQQKKEVQCTGNQSTQAQTSQEPPRRPGAPQSFDASE